MTPVYLTITSTAPRATDLGFLLHKHPDRAQTFERLGRARRTCSTRRRPTTGARPRCCSRSTRSRWCAAAGAAGRRVRARPVRQRPAVRGVLACWRSRWARSSAPPWPAAATPRPDLAGAPLPLRDPRAGAAAAAAAPSSCARLFEPLGWHGRGDAGRRWTRPCPAWGDSPLRRPPPDRRRCSSGRRAAAPLRPAAGARRRQALLGQPRRGRQAGPGRRRLARRAPGARADHPALPRATSASLTRRRVGRLAEVDDTEPEALDNADRGAAGRRRRPTGRCRWPCSAGGAVARGAARRAARRTRRRPRLRRGRAAARRCSRDPAFTEVARRRRLAPRARVAARRLRPGPDARPPAGAARAAPVAR